MENNGNVAIACQSGSPCAVVMIKSILKTGPINCRKGKKKVKQRRNSGKSTLADVANMAGVSTMTASRALREPEKCRQNFGKRSTRR
ncbi:LacI family DNA-binding transcriptional regulator [Sodalis ligni]|uniref:LacI family DNA-binding transcriptional regulator n=1 Tax=Sodalis ligni TaxID=2697027 RepID=UPI002097A3C1|nr:LacI family DNA-binding transcriptional regulator [Sodalis ligni]